jgi:hypothetical protein
MQCMFTGTIQAIESFNARFPSEAIKHDTRPNARNPLKNVEFRIRHGNQSVVGQIERQGITQMTAKANTEFRLCAGDYLKSARPNLDSMSYYSSLSITCNSGILFRSTYAQGYSQSVLLNLPIDNPYSVSSTADFEVNGVSLSPRGDIYYASSDPRLHQMQTNIPLRHATLHLEIQPRDSGESIKATLAPRGQFEILLGFWKK